MAVRILLITFQQALRSVALLIFPLTFIALVAWATAGSSSGNTTDPIRAAAWLWLGSHLIHFSLALPPAHIAGALTILPMAAALLPITIIRSGMARSAEVTGNLRASRIFFTFWYSAISLGLAALSRSDAIKADLLTAALYPILISVVAGISLPIKRLQELRFTVWSWVAILGASGVVAAFSLFAHYQVLKNLTIVDQPGIVGGALLLAIQIGYLPNLAIMALGYFTGAGVTIGAHTALSPLHFSLHGIPALPLLAALPNGKHPLYLVSDFLILALAVAQMLRARSARLRYRTAVAEILVSLALIALGGYLASGELLTREMNPVGIRFWYLDAIYGGCALVALLVVLAIPSLASYLMRRRRSRVAHAELEDAPLEVAP
jgi:hypothetical protein